MEVGSVELEARGRDLKIVLVFPCRSCGKVVECESYKYCPNCGSKLTDLERKPYLTMNNERAMRFLAFHVKETIGNIARDPQKGEELCGILKQRFCERPKVERNAAGEIIYGKDVYHDMGDRQ